MSCITDLNEFEECAVSCEIYLIVFKEALCWKVATIVFEQLLNIIK